MPAMKQLISLGLILFVVYAKIAWCMCDQHELSLQVENDSALTLGGGTDRFYSNGIEITHRCRQNKSTDDSTSNRATKSLLTLGAEEGFVEESSGARLGHKIYTNSDISLDASEINTDRDRPYAAWLYASFFYESEIQNSAYLRHEVSFGCVGPCAQGENVQREWHELFGFKQAQGWDLEIKNQVALQYFFEFKPKHTQLLPHISVQPRLKASIGTVFDDLSFGGEFVLNSKENSAKEKGQSIIDRWHWQLFIHNDVKFVAFNGTLEGSLFNDSSPHTVEPSRFVLENGVGVRFEYNQYSFQYRFVGSSTELEEQDWKFWDHKYGSFEFGSKF